MLASQMKQIRLNRLRQFECVLAVGSRGPKKLHEHPFALITGMYLRTDETGIEASKLLHAHDQCRHQPLHMERIDGEFNELAKPGITG
ncbi:hypothetical protein D3C76_1526320 [compost metagenome]